jgi:hypothetical protein
LFEAVNEFCRLSIPQNRQVRYVEDRTAGAFSLAMRQTEGTFLHLACLSLKVPSTEVSNEILKV